MVGAIARLIGRGRPIAMRAGCAARAAVYSPQKGGHAMLNVSGTTKRPIASFDDYFEAQRAVDRLSDEGFPVERVAIVGTGLRYVEQVTGRFTTGRAAAVGAVHGATLGALLALAFGLIFTLDPDPALLLLMLYGLVAGAGMGALLGAATHAAAGGTRDFASVAAMEAERYEILVDDEVADRAAALLRSPRPDRAGI
jgi:hypothetical protein